ncbi:MULTISPECIES: carboxypeptidase-like regulatory domain-containing protein [unclassified Corallococcus]|uniref:carboxypeptidase-like regulatory domain-containing protein n=1 Tax=unclassified Corallococcus TaxID=2685029 RepID=UPI001A8C5E1B|nr:MULTISPECIES: carboxypeptidase-like regulatory domain-containing protein [unclassified Corallococcus]MBN9684958.1 carboxypeptidase regulatory-like domain-containing protein [Corallococcus sp. NCSPR001]WAS83582.1 carboxypeptidase-like regulatory domain-containing protein [Corallococcus sp. NCRR]
MRWSWVGLLAVVLACAEAPRPVVKRWPLEEVAVSVRVVDAANQPIPGVSLVARRADRGSAVAREGTTDAAGTARLQVMPGWYVLQAQARGFVSVTRTDARVPFGDEVRWDVTLERAAPVAGRVVDLEGRPVAGARLELNLSDETLSVPPAESDAEGRFQFDGVPAGTVKLRAEKKGWSPTRLELAAPAPEVTVVMAGLGKMRVRVLDPQLRRMPEPSVSISLAEEGERPITKSPIQVPEAILFLNLPAGRYHVSGRYEPSAGCGWERVIEVQVLPGQQVEATVSFEGVEGFGPWRARAVDDKGRALGGGKVMAWMGESGEDAPGLRGRCEARVEPDGSFALSRVLGRPFMVAWNSDEPSPTRLLKGAFGAGTGEALVFPPESGALKGRVVRPDGWPVGYFEVDGVSPNNPRSEYVQNVWMTQTYQWVIDVLGFAPALVRAQGRVGEVLQVPDVVLDEGRTVQGRVFARDGRTGVPGQEVELVEGFDLETKARRRPHTVTTDAGGRFRFEHVAGRRLFLRVDAKERGTVLQTLEPDASAVRLRLVPRAELQGSVTDGAQVPLAGVGLRVRCEGGFEASTETDWTGHYAVNIPGDRECFVHPVVSPLNVRDVFLPPPVSFAPTRLRLTPGSRHALDPVPRQGAASLKVSVEASREFVTAFLLPGDVPWPRSSESLDALIRAGFNPDGDDDGFAPSFMLGAVFHFSHLPLGHYTLFIRDEMDGADAVLRMPVELTGSGVHVVQSERPGLGGGRPYTR